jgi:hypothetical protein
MFGERHLNKPHAPLDGARRSRDVGFESHGDSKGGGIVTMLRERRDIDRTVRPVRFTTEWVLGSIGAIAALIGAWMFHAPEAGTLTFFGWDWDVATLSEAWPLGLLTLGGLAAAAGFGTMAQKMFFRDDEVTLETFAAGAMAFVGAAVVVAYALIWIF